MARLIPEGDIERVKRETDLVALIRSRGIELRKHGSKDLIGRCPFHDDAETPNLIVSPDKGLWHCMACGKAGNAIQFVAQHDGLSFRHAFELLTEGQSAAFASQPLTHCNTVPRLPCPLDPDADDATLFGQVVEYYHDRLKTSSAGRGYLAARGLDDDGLIERFQLGFADRSLGLRLPYRNRDQGEKLRQRLQQLGLWRESGHEHFTGCVVVPFHDTGGKAVSLYGRRVTSGTIRHLYPPGPHQGLFNRQAFEADEVILCEAVLDALTFWRHGFRNVSALFGTEGFTDELWEALSRVKRVRLAYDADEAGERAAERDAQRLRAAGIEVFRIRFPLGMDANEYARKVTPADKSLALLLNSSTWLGRGSQSKPGPTVAAPRDPPKHVAMVVDDITDKPLPAVDRESLETDVGWAPEPSVPAPYAEVVAQAAASSSLAANVSGLSEDAAKEEMAVAPVVGLVAPPMPPARAVLEGRGDAWFLDLDGREYRVAGLEKTVGTDALKVTLRLRVTTAGREDRFHLDQVDLTRDQERRRFIERASEETGLLPDLLKRDLGRLLLAVEQAQAELAKPAEEEPVVTLSPEEREEALGWLRAPDLVGRLRRAFHQVGIIGEETNALVAYLACVSRKLDRPLAIIIQSASAAGKTTLMDAVLSFFPEEERVKYSAMTGQSLYYLGETNLRHKILAVVEEAGAEKASYALKLLQSEGELTIASTGKDPATGKMITQEYRVEGPVMIFLTTTAIDLDEELQNRCLTLAVDESPEQTARIHRLQRERRTLADLVARQERKGLLATLRNAQRLLASLVVVNPFAPELTFATGRTRNRRDHEKYLTLIDAIALLHQHQRAMKSLPDAREGSASYIEVNFEDVALANELVPEILGRSLDELPPQTRRLLGHICELARRKRQENGAKAAGFFSRKELREVCGWSLTQVRVHLERLVELEYLALRHGRLGNPFVYELLIDPDQSEAVAHIGLIDVAKLQHPYAGKVAAFESGVAGRNGQVTGDDRTHSPPLSASTPQTCGVGGGMTETHIRGLAVQATL